MKGILKTDKMLNLFKGLFDNSLFEIVLVAIALYRFGHYRNAVGTMKVAL